MSGMDSNLNRQAPASPGGAPNENSPRPVGTLSLMVSEARGLRSFQNSLGVYKYGSSCNPYAVVNFEGNQFRTSTKQETSSPVWLGREEGGSEFPIMDVTSNVRILVYHNRRMGLNDELIGIVQIPLTLLYTAFTASSEQEAWFELYPPAKSNGFGQRKYKSAIDEIDESGMPRPNRTMGYLKIWYRLELLSSLPPFLLYAKAPLSESEKAAPITEFEGERFRRNMARVKAAMKKPRWVMEAEYILEWHNPLLSLCAFSVLSRLCLFGNMWEVPLILYAILCLANVAGFQQRRFPNVRIWNDEVEDDPDNPNNPIERMFNIRYKLYLIQTALGQLATTLEKITALFDWTDSCISLLVLLQLAALTLVLTVLLALFQPGQIIFMATVLASSYMYTHRDERRKAAEAKANKKKIRTKDKDSADIDGSNRRSGSQPSSPDASSGTGQPRLSLSAPEAPEEDHGQWGLMSYVTNVASRIPDSEEVAHRYIASRQMIHDTKFVDIVT
eukprot:Clim_evm87s150 gene=Clim_evmTU87s150